MAAMQQFKINRDKLLSCIFFDWENNRENYNIKEEHIYSALKTLLPKEEYVIKTYFGVSGFNRITLKEIGLSLNLSRARIGQIKCKAIRKLKHPSRLRILKNEPKVIPETPSLLPLDVFAGKIDLEKFKDFSIGELPLSIRTYNCFENYNIRNIYELTQKNEKELLCFKNFGKKSLREIKEILNDLNLHLDMRF